MLSVIDSVQYIQLDIDYSYGIIALSILIACVAAFASIRLNARIGQDSFMQGYIWSALASITMSLGIWSMHFIGMSALKIHDEMKINYFTTFLSILPALIATYIAFHLVSRERAGLKLYVLASVMMGAAIGIMHYIGMAAMSFGNIVIQYNYYIVAGSIFLAMIVSFVALTVMIRYKQYIHLLPVQIGVAALLGGAVSTVHYMGLGAMTYYTEASLIHDGSWLSHDMRSMNILVSCCVALLVVIFLSASAFDRYATYRLKHLDALTQLPNRYAFLKVINEDKRAHSVAIISFEKLSFSTREYDFRTDELVIDRVVAVLKKNVPSMTTLYRINEQHFIYVAKDAQATHELLQFLDVKMKVLAQGFQIDGEDIKVSAVCLVNHANETASIQQLHANAMLVEKHPGTEYNFAIIHYNENYHTRHFTDQLLHDLDKSLEREELYLVYQPKINPKEGKVHSVEALVRWQHPEYGFLSPGVFIPILEAHNRLNELTDWLIEEVCKDLNAWKMNSNMPKKISINIPGPYLTSNRLKMHLVAMTQMYKVDPSQIELEVTETSFVKSVEEARQAVDYFRKLRFDVALDDFGIGVSSLAYLKDFGFTTLKIDKSFMDYVPHSEKDCAIMRSILSLGKTLKMQVVAEGIESEEQVKFLLGASREILIQGYYYAKPMSIKDLEIWCDNEKLNLQPQIMEI